MHTKNIKKLPFLFVMGLLIAACGSQTANTPPSLPATEEPAPVIEATATLPSLTDTPIPTETALPSEQPTTDPASSGATVSFANDVLPILQSRCVNCHGGDRVEEGLLLRSYEELMAGSENGPVVIAGDAENSLLVELIVTQKMPKRGAKLTPPQVQTIIDWINQGALNN